MPSAATAPGRHLVPTLAARHAAFDRLAPALVSHGFEVTAIDLPGHGLSEFRAACSSYTNVEYAVNVAHLLRDAGWTDHGRTFALVGHSMGGARPRARAHAAGEWR